MLAGGIRKAISHIVFSKISKIVWRERERERGRRQAKSPRQSPQRAPREGPRRAPRGPAERRKKRERDDKKTLFVCPNGSVVDSPPHKTRRKKTVAARCRGYAAPIFHLAVGGTPQEVLNQAYRVKFSVRACVRPKMKKIVSTAGPLFAMFFDQKMRKKKVRQSFCSGSRAY